MLGYSATETAVIHHLRAMMQAKRLYGSMEAAKVNPAFRQASLFPQFLVCGVGAGFTELEGLSTMLIVSGRRSISLKKECFAWTLRTETMR